MPAAFALPAWFFCSFRREYGTDLFFLSSFIVAKYFAALSFVVASISSVRALLPPYLNLLEQSNVRGCLVKLRCSCKGEFLAQVFAPLRFRTVHLGRENPAILPLLDNSFNQDLDFWRYISPGGSFSAIHLAEPSFSHLQTRAGILAGGFLLSGVM